MGNKIWYKEILDIYRISCTFFLVVRYVTWFVIAESLHVYTLAIYVNPHVTSCTIINYTACTPAATNVITPDLGKTQEISYKDSKTNTTNFTVNKKKLGDWWIIKMFHQWVSCQRKYVTVCTFWKIKPKLSSFLIRVNLLRPWLPLFLYGLLLSLCCFSFLVNCYFQGFFSWWIILCVAKRLKITWLSATYCILK